MNSVNCASNARFNESVVYLVTAVDNSSNEVCLDENLIRTFYLGLVVVQDSFTNKEPTKLTCLAWTSLVKG